MCMLAHRSKYCSGLKVQVMTAMLLIFIYLFVLFVCFYFQQPRKARHLSMTSLALSSVRWWCQPFLLVKLQKRNNRFVPVCWLILYLSLSNGAVLSLLSQWFSFSSVLHILSTTEIWFYILFLSSECSVSLLFHLFVLSDDLPFYIPLVLFSICCFTIV